MARLGRAAERWLLFAAGLVVWELVTRSAANPYFPPPTAIGATAVRLWLSGPADRLFLARPVFHDVLPSLGRLLVGWLLASVVGVVVGLVLGRSRTAAQYCTGLLAFLRALPAPTLVPVFLVLFHIGPTMEIATIVFGSVWPVLVNSLDGARSIDPVTIHTARAFGVPPLLRAVGVIVPASAPKVFAGLRISLSIAFILMVISELVGSTSGIGYQLVFAYGDSDLPAMWAWIVLLGALGYACNGALVTVERRALRWTGPATTN